MKPEDVPDELARTAVEGYYGHAVPDGGFAVLRGEWQRALAAVLPAHEAMVRAKVAAEIKAEMCEPRWNLDTSVGEVLVFRKVIDITRGEPKEPPCAHCHTPYATCHQELASCCVHCHHRPRSSEPGDQEGTTP